MKKILISLIAIIILTGCATVFTGSTDKVSIYSYPEGAKVHIDGYYKGKTPCTINLERDYATKYARIEHPPYIDTIIKLNKSFNEIALLNLLTFGLDLGTFLFIDIITGNIIEYNPDIYSVNAVNYVDTTRRENIPINTDNEVPKNVSGFGTGFVVSNNGYVATNYHVIENATYLELYFPNDSNIFTRYTAKLIAQDLSNDLAILKIQDDNNINWNIPYKFELDYSTGEDVFTIGYPDPQLLGIDYKLTDGIINSLSGVLSNRSIMQISTSLQPGNSGGPLFNSDGNIVGITSSTINNEYFYSRTGAIAQNINYAVKIDYLNVLAKEFNFYNQVSSNSFIETVDELKHKANILKNYVCCILTYK